MHPHDRRYAKTHEWAKADGEVVRVGLTFYAQDQLGDVTFVELPEVGRKLAQGEPFGAVESLKAVADLNAPVVGTVVEVNEALAESPELVNQEPYERGWMVAIKFVDPGALDGLMTAAEYEQMVSDGG